MADQPTPPPPPPPQDQGSGQDPKQDDQNATPPPRPGDDVPKEGLDPTQVFATPPAPPPPPQQGGQGQIQGGQGQAQAGGQQPAAGQAAPPQDSGKPPPPPGTQATKEMGYDDEDIRVLGIVGDYRFGSISTSLTTENIAVPEHGETKFDEQQFIQLLAGSISLMRDEKWRIIQAIPKLSQFQIDELFKILNEEKKKFSELSPKHLLQLQKLEQKHGEEWKDLQSLMVQQGVKQEDQAKADEIRKQLGL